jgi:RNA polymerase sigma factor (sigma-70 family)
MDNDAVDDLLKKLNSGDEQAAEQVFLEYEPYLRMVVRRMLPAWLRPKFDSQDVVHSVWADLLHGFRAAGWRFTDAAHLRAFLGKVTRNRFLDRYRQHQMTKDREKPLENIFCDPPAGKDPRPSESAQANELWDRIMAACPPGHRNLLLLRRQGYTFDEISAKTGFHPSSLRRIFYRLAEKIAFSENQSGPISGND